MNCEGIITQSLQKDCVNHPNGFERIGCIINRGDIDWSLTALTSGTTNVLGGIALLSGKVGYQVLQYGTKPFNGT